MTRKLLCIERLSAGYGGRPVLVDFKFELKRGERVALIGPNGCGKSTLLRTVMAEVPESSGTVIFDGGDITRLETDKIVSRGIGYLRQTRNVFPGLTVNENLELAAIDQGGVTTKRRELLLEALPLLRGRELVRAGLMSGGERQALATAMALMKPASLILLDEPVAGLLQKNASDLLAGLSRMQQAEGFAMVIVEHQLKQIRPHVDRVVVMVKGQIREDTIDTSLLESRERLEKHYLI